MVMPAFGATGLDTSDPATFAGSTGFMAPSSMGSSAGFRETVSGAALDRPATADLDFLPDPDGEVLDRTTALALLRDASSQSRSVFETNVHSTWARSYRAIRNEHFSGSLYLTDAYKTRSKIFKPKTRSALWKRLATTAAALFTTGDVVSVQAEDETNPQQVAAAALKMEVLNYRLGTPSLRNGIPWYLTALGARFDADVTNICVSKQFWNFKEEEHPTKVEMVYDQDPETGMPMPRLQRKKTIKIDKPDILLIPPENVRFDPNCNWTNIAQLSQYLLLHFPMTPDAAWTMVQQNQHARIPWLPGVDYATFENHTGGSPSETTSPRSARAGGRDTTQEMTGKFKTVWLTEVFMRHRGLDYVYWAMNDSVLLSEPALVEDVYPWNFGERPVVIGTGSMEPHRTYSMSPVESWQQLQAEANDLANLRLDREKQIVSPPTLVKRATKVDLQAVQRKGSNSIILVNDMADVQPMELPDVPSSVFNEASMINADLDDLAGNFNASSVQTNRDLNETVGGMHLLSEAGNKVSDLDMSTWAETWAQPVVLQLLKLEEYYETDEKVLAICGQRANLWERYGVSEITDELLRAETTAKVNIGIGATSLPMERMKRFSAAWDVTAKALAPFIQSGKVEVMPNPENIVTDIFGAAGFKDGGARYFTKIELAQPNPNPPPDPKVLAAQAQMQRNQVAQEANQGKMMLDAHRLAHERQAQQAQLLNDAANRRTAIDVQHMKVIADLDRDRTAAQQAGATQAHDHAHDHVKSFVSAMAQHLAPKPEASAGSGTNLGASKKFDETKPMLAALPSPHDQPQPAMFANLEEHAK